MESPPLAELCSLDNSSLYEHFGNSVLPSDPNQTYEEFLLAHSGVCKQYRIEDIVSIVVPIVFTVIVVLGVIGNTHVIMIVLFGKQMRSTTNVLILVSVNFTLPKIMPYYRNTALFLTLISGLLIRIILSNERTKKVSAQIWNALHGPAIHYKSIPSPFSLHLKKG